MPRLKKITLDAGNSRAIESSQNPRVARRPVFYAGETVSVDVNPVELATQADNTSAYETIRISGANTVGMRLGTTTTLVAQGTEFSYTLPTRYQATLAFTTAPAVQIPLTLETAAVPTLAPVLEVANFKPAATTAATAYGSVTAVLRAVLAPSVLPATTVAVPIELPDAFRYPGMEVFIAGTAVTFSATLNSPVSAGFSVTTAGDAVSAIAITRAGSGYPDGTHSLTFTGGTVTSVAEATCVASGGSIVSVTIVDGGSGYVTKPSASLFTPDRSVSSVLPSIIRATVNDRPQFHWHRPVAGGNVVTLSFTVPTSTATPVTAISPVICMEYVTLDAEGMPVWQINVVCAGYGYLTAPAVTVPAHSVSARRRTTTATVSGNNLQVAVTYDNESVANAEDGSLIPGNDPYHLALSGPYYDSAGGGSGRGPFPNGAIGAELRAGTYPMITSNRTPEGEAKVMLLPSARGTLGRDFLGYGIGSKANLLRLEYEPGQLTANAMRTLAGRSFICAVIPQRDPGLASVATLNALNETAPDRYAIVRVTLRDYPGGFPDYYVGQNYIYDEGGSGVLRLATDGLLSPEGSGGSSGLSYYAPGGGFFEPTIEFLDYGKGYKTPQFMGTNAHQRFSYNLRVLSGLKPGFVIDETPGGRTVTAVTTGTLDADSFIQTSYSERATVITQQGDQGVQTVVLNGGFGYQKSGSFVSSQVTVGGRLRAVEIVNRPVGYGYGTWTCTVSGGGGSGAEVRLVHTQTLFDPSNPQTISRSGVFSATVVCAGSGYTTAPSIIPPAPTFSGAYLTAVVRGGAVASQALSAVNRSEVLGPAKATGIVAKSGFLSALGYEITPLSTLGAAVVDADGKTQVVGRPQITRYYGCVCQGVYYKTRNITMKTMLDQIPRRSGWISVDPDNPVPDGFDLVDELFDVEFSGPAYRYPLVFDASPETHGTAEGFAVFTQVDLRSPEEAMRIYITKTGYGYVTQPSVTIQAPPIAGHYIKSLTIADGFGSVLPDFDGNDFYGYTSSQLTVTSAGLRFTGGKQVIFKPVLYPNSGIPVSDKPDQYGRVSLTNADGYQCTVSPAPLFGDDNFMLNVRELDFDYARTYQFGNNALLANNVPFAVERERIWKLYEGRKVHYVRRTNFTPAVYSSTPTVSVPTFSGCAITSVTVVCQGYWYSADSATLTNLDPTGTGAVITVTEIKNGKITKVSLTEGGALFSDSPQIVVAPPGDNPADLPSNFGVKNNLAITVASANAVLGTANSADTLLELYEIEGANQHVIAQVPVTLAKRVSAA